ncbi:MAG: radical SAM family heme chaperone HemW [Synergistaceae bacterium]|nr:radical SAM family heme chaperone HemW [Synergistaceae bacterium]
MKINSLYVHVPFCESKCGYCSFYSEAGRFCDVEAWLEALDVEAKKYFDDDKIKLRTLYVGGGTPSTLTLSQWQKLIDILTRYFDFSGLTEATSEANPNSLKPEHVKFLRENNFTRLSLGVQSLNDSELAILGRLHNSRKAFSAMELVRNSGLNLSCDLIFGVPSQSLRSWDYSLKSVMNFANHVSCYQLTLEPDTPLAKKYGNDELNTAGYKFYRYAQYILPKKNFAQYEISNFAPPGFECQHNLAYWHQDNVIALGPSAVSYVDGVRYANPAMLDEYFHAAKNNFPEESRTYESLSPHDRNIELIILSLRTKWGVSRELLTPEVEAKISDMPEDLFIITDERISLSKRGMRLGNSIWSELI